MYKFNLLKQTDIVGRVIFYEGLLPTAILQQYSVAARLTHWYFPTDFFLKTLDVTTKTGYF